MELLLADNSSNLMIRIFRRLVAPALLAGVLSNLAVYRMLGSDEQAFQDWKSMGMMTAIALAGFVVGGIPALFLFKDGQVVSNKVGAAPKAALENWIKSAI